MRNFVTVQIIFLLLSYNTWAQVSFNNLALTGISVIDANHHKPLAHQTVLITHNLIGDIFTDGSKPIPDSFNVLKMEGKYLLPGLIDTHVHMATDPTDVDNRASTLSVLSRMLYSGITSVRDMAGDARTLASLSRDAITGDIVSPGIYYSALIAGPQFFNDPRTVSSSAGFSAGKAPFMRAVSDSTNLVLAIAEAKGTGATGIKLYADLSAELAAKIIAEAKKQDVKVWGHAWLQQAKPSDLVKAGISSISHAPLLIYDNFDSIPVSWRSKHDDAFWNDSAHIRTSLFKLMKDNNTILDATLATYKEASKDEKSRWYYQYQIGKRLIADAYKSGITICTGTDDDQVKFVQYEMELLVSEAGFSNIDAIIAATKNGAEAIGIEKTHGTIETGKIANLVVLNKNPVEKIENIESVYLVIKDGRIYKK
jgi:hypothetical protein